MAGNHDVWTVLPHDPLEELTENLWRVEGSMSGMPVRRCMIVLRLRDGRLVIHNPIALEEAEMKRIEAWGTPSILVVPNGWHRIDARPFKARYPSLRVVCPEKARAKVEQVVPVDGTFDSFDPASDEVVFRHLPGVKHEEGVMEARSRDGLSLVFNDLIHNNPPFSGLQGLFFGLMTGKDPPRHHRAVGAMIIHQKKALRDELLRLADTPDLRRVLVAHGAPILSGAAEALRHVAAAL